MKKVSLVTIVLSIVALLVTSCAPAATPTPRTVVETVVVEVPVRETVVVEVTPTPEKELSSLIVPLCWLKNDEFVALVAADELGYYGEAGFDVTLVSGGGSTGFDPVYAINGFDPHIRIGVQASMAEVIKAYAEGIDIVAVAALLQEEPVGFLTLITEDRRAEGPCDFKGRTISMQTEATWYVDALGAVCPPDKGGPLKAGEDFTVIPAGWTPDCLMADQCDFYCAWSTNQPFMLTQQGMVDGQDYEMFLVSSYLPFYYGDVIVTTRAHLEQNPETVRGFVEATIRGLRFVLDNPEEGIAIASRIEGVDPDHAAWRIPVQNKLVVSGDTEVHGLGWMSLEKVQEMIQFLYDHGQVDKVFDASEIVDNSFLPGS